MRKWCLSFVAPCLAMHAWICSFDWVCCTSPLIIIISLLLQQKWHTKKIASLSSYRYKVQSSINFLLQLTSRGAMQHMWDGHTTASPCCTYTYVYAWINVYVCLCMNNCMCLQSNKTIKSQITAVFFVCAASFRTRVCLCWCVVTLW